MTGNTAEAVDRKDLQASVRERRVQRSNSLTVPGKAANSQPSALTAGANKIDLGCRSRGAF